MISLSLRSKRGVALKPFCYLFSRLKPMFALEAVSFTALGPLLTLNSCFVSLCEGRELAFLITTFLFFFLFFLKLVFDAI